MLIAQLTGSQMVLSHLKCPWGKSIISLIHTSKSKQYLARESGLHFSCNSGQQSRKAQQSPTCTAQPTPYSDNLSMIWSHKHPWSGKHLVKHGILREGLSRSQWPSAPAHSLLAAGWGASFAPPHFKAPLDATTKTGWELHFPGKVHSKSKGQTNASFSGIRILRKSKHANEQALK